MPIDLALQGARRVIEHIDLPAGHVIVGQLHDVIEIRARLADMKDVDKPLMRARDRLEAAHPLELALEGAIAIESIPMHHLHRPERAGQGPRQPDLAIGAAPDHAQHFVIGNDRDRLLSAHGHLRVGSGSNIRS